MYFGSHAPGPPLQQPGYYGLDAGPGCLPCNCSMSGSLSDDCTEEGRCHCVPGVAGEKCDRCARGFHAYQDGGCTPCDCAHTQHTCHPESGECICPPYTQGTTCDECEDGYWGHDLELGCQVCTTICIFLTGKHFVGASFTPSL